LVVKGFAGQLDVLAPEVPDSLLGSLYAAILARSGCRPQHCLYFEDKHLGDGSSLSDHVVELGKGLDPRGKFADEEAALDKLDLHMRSIAGEATAARARVIELQAELWERCAPVVSGHQTDALAAAQPCENAPARRSSSAAVAERTASGLAPVSSAGAREPPARTAAGLQTLDAGVQTLEADFLAADAAGGAGPRQLWLVVGGECEGICVQESEDAGSQLLAEHLSTGAYIEELVLREGRLCFRRLSGSGPRTGWVSVHGPSGSAATVRMSSAPSRSPSEPLPIALLFPGQGSEYVRMLSVVKDLPPVKEMLDKAASILGYSVLDVCLNGPADRLHRSLCCQPAVFVAGLAALERLRQMKPEAVERPSVMSGLFMGEYSALCAAGVLTFEDGLRLVKACGEAAEGAHREKRQGMILCAGLEKDELESHCSRAVEFEGAGSSCQVAACLFPRGYCVGGTEAAIAFLLDVAEKGGASVNRLPVEVALHTPMAGPVLRKFSAVLEEVLPRMRPPSHTVWVNSAEPIGPGSSPTVVAAHLKEQLTRPALWEQAVRGMMRAGVEEFYEVGPMKWLKAMMSAIDRSAWERTICIGV